MAENLDNPTFGNFSIENTMDMGLGSAELLNDLMAPETASADPDGLQKIVNEVADDAPPAPAPPKKAPAKTTGDVIADSSEEKKQEEDAGATLQKFLSEGEGDEEEEDDAPKAKAPRAAEAKEEEDGAEDEPVVSRFTALANDLFKLGVFTKEDDEEDVDVSTPEAFLERFQAEKRRGAIEVVNNFIGQFGEDYQQAFDAIFVKGVNPKDYFGAYNQIVSFSEMDLSKEDNQVAVIKQALADQGFESEDIDTEVERLKNYGDLESVATKHHKVLVKKETARLHKMEEKAQEELQQKAYIKNQYVQNVQTVLQEKLKAKEFDGIPINPKLAGELQDFLLVDKYKTANGETLTDFDRTILELKRPENHAMKVKVALLLKVLEKDPTLSTVQRSGVTKKSNELFGEVARQVERSSIKGSKSQKQQSSNSWFM